jgi:replicative DNA helicase
VADDLPRALSPEEFAARLQDQSKNQNGSNGVGHAPPEGFFDEHDRVVEAELAPTNTPPFDMDAEGAVLSAILVQGTPALDRVSATLAPECFYSEAHRQIYEACLYLRSLDTPIDTVTVNTRIRDVGRIEQVGGLAYLTEVINSAPAIANVGAYAETVHTLWQKRQALFACQLATAQLYAREQDSELILHNLRATLDDLTPKKTVFGFEDILGQWQEEGPLVHEPTGMPTLDNLTGGGPVYGSRWYVLGAPDAGKTALIAQIGHHYLDRGIPVGFLAIDEEPGDLVGRFAQRFGIRRAECEKREPRTLEFLRRALSHLRVRFYGPGRSIESAADDLAQFAKGFAKQAVLLVDSIQTVASAKVFGQQDLSLREIVTENVKALRACATRHKMIAIATSEMSRSFYRIVEGQDKLNDLAAGKESGAIEYSARVMLSLRSVKGEPDLIRIDVPKNKHGLSGAVLHMRIDRAHMKLEEAPAPDDPNDSETKQAERVQREQFEEERRSAKMETVRLAREAALKGDEDALEAILKECPGVGIRDLRIKMSTRLGGCSRQRMDETIERMKDRIRVEKGAHNHFFHYLNEK